MGEWILRLVEPVIARVMVSLGIGYITFTSVQDILDGVIDSVTTAFSGLGANVLKIISLYGIPEALGIILGGLTFSLTLISLKRFKIF